MNQHKYESNRGIGFFENSLPKDNRSYRHKYINKSDLTNT